MDDTLLNKYFNQQVQISPDTADDFELVLQNARTILQMVNSADDRFSIDPIRASDYWQKLEVSRDMVHDLYYVVLQEVGSIDWAPDDRDRFYAFNHLESREKSTLAQNLQIVNLDEGDDIPLPRPARGHMFVSDENCDWENTTDLTRRGDIVPYLVRRRLRKLIRDANSKLPQPGKVLDCEEFNCPAITLIFYNDGNQEIRVDFEPMIRAQLSFDNWPGWPRANKWPDPVVIHKVRREGIDLIARENFHWTVSFTEAERTLVDKADSDRGKRKQLFRTLVKINDEFWRLEESGTVITPYMLKNVWFWEMQRNPHSWQWGGVLWPSLQGMCRALLSSINNRELNQYFFPDHNLMATKTPEELDAVAEKIQSFLNDPECFIDTLGEDDIGYDYKVSQTLQDARSTIILVDNDHTYKEPRTRCDCCLL